MEGYGHLMEDKKEAIQQIAEEIDEQDTGITEETIDESSHVDDYTVPQAEGSAPEEEPEEEQDVFAVLDINLPKPEKEQEEILCGEFERYDTKDE